VPTLQRLGKECIFPDETTRRRRVRQLNISAELYPHSRSEPATAFGVPHRTPLSLPTQLFPWQDIRLHVFNPLEENGEENGDSDAMGSALGVTISTHQLAGMLYFHIVLITDAPAPPYHTCAGPVCSGADNPSYLKYLWDATLQTETYGNGRSVDDGESDDNEDDENNHTDDYYDDSEYDSDDYNRRRQQDHAAALSHGQRRNAIRSGYKRHRDDDGVETATKRARFGSDGPAEHSDVLRTDNPVSEYADLSMQEISAISIAREDPAPTWVAIYDTHSFELTKLVCNDAALKLFGWNASELDLRVHLKHAVRWLHPEDVLVRRYAAIVCELIQRSAADVCHVMDCSVVAVNARKGCLPSYTFEGLYLRRKEVVDAPTSAVLQIREGIQALKASTDVSLPTSTPSFGRNGSSASFGRVNGLAPPPSLPLTKSASSTSVTRLPAVALSLSKSSSTASVAHIVTGASVLSDVEQLESAFEEFDDAIVYQVFEATEVVSNMYDSSNVTHVVVTKFTNVRMHDAGEDDLVRPTDFDVSESRAVFQADIAHLMHHQSSTEVEPLEDTSLAHDLDTLSAASVLASSLSLPAPGNTTSSTVSARHGPPTTVPAGANRQSRSGAARTTTVAPVFPGAAQSRSRAQPAGTTTTRPPVFPGHGTPVGRLATDRSTDRSITAQLVLWQNSFPEALADLSQAPGDPFQRPLPLPAEHLQSSHLATGDFEASGRFFSTRLRTGDSVRSSDMNIR
jgi:PAS domain-containing protein